MMQVVNEALLSMPYKHAAPVIHEINRQIQAIQESEKIKDMEQNALDMTDVAHSESRAELSGYMGGDSDAAGK